MSNVRLRILSPAYSGFTARNISSLLGLRRLCADAGIAFQWSAVEDVGDIVWARNLIGHTFEAGDSTHLLMVDGDIGYPPEIVLRMIARDVPFACAAPPARALRLDLFAKAAKEGHESPSRFLPKFYVIPTKEDSESKKFSIDDKGFVKIESIGGAFLLLRREVFTEIAAGGEVSSYVKDEKKITGYFDHMSVGDARLAEDRAFCRRWRNVGGDIYLLPDAPMTHTGPYTFSGDYGKFSGTSPSDVT